MSAELHRAVAALIKPTRVCLYRDGSDVCEWQDIPSIWDHLLASTRWGNGNGGATSRFGSRPVIATGVVSLLMEITQAALETATELVGQSRGDVPGNLLAIAATLKDAEQIGWWTERLTGWTADARSQLRLDPERPRSVRGARCPECGAKTTHKRRDGEVVRQPALAVTWVGPDDDEYHPDDSWHVRAVECTACGRAWFRGEAMNSLIDAMIKANTTRETLAHTVSEVP